MRKHLAIITALALTMSLLMSTCAVFAINDSTESTSQTYTVNNQTETDNQSGVNNDNWSNGESGTDSNYTTNNENGYDSNSDSEYDPPDAQDYGPSVDTSWFDFRNPKKKYVLNTEAQLYGLASLVNEEQAYWKPNHTEKFAGVTFELKSDITLTRDFTPIGTSGTPFKGIFDGKGHTISGLKIDSNNKYTGLFGYLSGTVKNLQVEGTVISSTDYTGTFAGKIDEDGKIINCVSFAAVTAKEKTGGIVGENKGGSVNNCLNHGRVKGTTRVGGVVGENFAGEVTRCGNTGKVLSTKRGFGTYGTGGVAGRSVGATSVVKECYNTGNIKSITEATGGVVGYTNAAGATISNSYNTGDIVVDAPAKSAVMSKVLSYSGGVIGIVGTDGIVIKNNYNTGTSHGADNSGGVIGYYTSEENVEPYPFISNNYYINTEYKFGIGIYLTDTGSNIPNSVSSVTQSTISGLQNTLGDSFKKDSSGVYGNGGNPVLVWQKPISEDEKEYIENISLKAQKRLDKYMATRGDSFVSQLVLDIFNTANLFQIFK